MSRVGDPKHWRDRADEIRVLADAMDDAKARTLMLRLAEQYDELAHSVDIWSERMSVVRQARDNPQTRDNLKVAPRIIGLIIN